MLKLLNRDCPEDDPSSEELEPPPPPPPPEPPPPGDGLGPGGTGGVGGTGGGPGGAGGDGGTGTTLLCPKIEPAPTVMLAADAPASNAMFVPTAFTVLTPGPVIPFAPTVSVDGACTVTFHCAGNEPPGALAPAVMLMLCPVVGAEAKLVSIVELVPIARVPPVVLS